MQNTTQQHLVCLLGNDGREPCLHLWESIWRTKITVFHSLVPDIIVQVCIKIWIISIYRWKLLKFINFAVETETLYNLGHLPMKQKDFKRRYRPLAATYLTFSPDGNELLVNLGGEQIYLFDITRQGHRKSLLSVIKEKVALTVSSQQLSEQKSKSEFQYTEQLFSLSM